jgi:predicted nucleotidyltransferase
MARFGLVRNRNELCMKTNVETQKIELRWIDTVNDELLDEIVRRIVQTVDPDKIILFGSYAYGQPQNDSDLDILVILQSDKPRWQRSVPVYNSLRGLLIPKDVLVYTPEEVEEWSEVPEAFITTVIRKGKVLYEKEKSSRSC